MKSFLFSHNDFGTPNVVNQMWKGVDRGRGLPKIPKFVWTSFMDDPSEGFKSDQIYHCAWEAIRILEAVGLKVRAVVADGASPNRRFIRLHNMIDNGNMEDVVIYWTWNEWCPGELIWFYVVLLSLYWAKLLNLEVERKKDLQHVYLVLQEWIIFGR